MSIRQGTRPAFLFGETLTGQPAGSYSLLQVRRAGDETILRVKDSGIGIAEDFMPTFFKAFTQESTGLTWTHGSIGLGPTVTQRLVALLRGVIDLESTKNPGSTFTVRFPAIALSVPASPRRPRMPEATYISAEPFTKRNAHVFRMKRCFLVVES